MGFFTSRSGKIEPHYEELREKENPTEEEKAEMRVMEHKITENLSQKNQSEEN